MTLKQMIKELAKINAHGPTFELMSGIIHKLQAHIELLEKRLGVAKAALEYIAQTSGVENVDNVDYIAEVVDERKFDISESKKALREIEGMLE